MRVDFYASIGAAARGNQHTNPSRTYAVQRLGDRLQKSTHFRIFRRRTHDTDQHYPLVIKIVSAAISIIGPADNALSYLVFAISLRQPSHHRCGSCGLNITQIINFYVGSELDWLTFFLNISINVGLAKIFVGAKVVGNSMSYNFYPTCFSLFVFVHGL